jgi:hypothetical protein
LITLEIITGPISAIFFFVGLLALGNWIFKWGKSGNGSTHEKVAIGYGLLYVIYHLFHFILEPKHIWISISTLILICIFSERKSLLMKIKDIYLRSTFVWLVFIILIPFFFRLISPPISNDGLSFYLPQVAWLYEYGLKFNPFLTQYTTMPQGIQILFTLPYGVSGYSGVRFMDAFAALALLHVIYQECRNLLNESYSKIFVLFALLLKGTILFLFGTGKIDTWSTYIFTIGFFAFFKGIHSKNYLNVFIIFSVILSIKYTNWVLMVLPLLWLAYLLFRALPLLQWTFLMQVPLFFAGSVLIRNHIQVNNALSPFFLNGLESRYVHNHGPILYDNPFEITNFKFENGILIMNYLSHPIFIVSCFFVLFFYFHYRKVQFSNMIRFGIYLFILMMIPWFVIFGSSAQPIRFLWGPILLLFTISLMVWKEIQFAQTFPKKTPLILVCTLGLTLIFFSYFKGRQYVYNFFQLPNKSLSEWYAQVGRHHYAMSYRIKELGLHNQKIFYESRVALGAFEVHEFGRFPDQDEFFNRNKGEWNGYDFLLLNGHSKAQLFQKEEVLLQYNDYYLIQLK